MRLCDGEVVDVYEVKGNSLEEVLSLLATGVAEIKDEYSYINTSVQYIDEHIGLVYAHR